MSLAVDPRELDAKGNNDGRWPCSECGERVMFAIPRGDRPVCGDCLEGRTPLKRENARLRAALPMRRVIVESPFAGDVEANLAYARRAMADCLRRGEAPYASHALYTQPGVLDDTSASERALGINAGFAWGGSPMRWWPTWTAACRAA